MFFALCQSCHGGDEEEGEEGEEGEGGDEGGAGASLQVRQDLFLFRYDLIEIVNLYSWIELAVDLSGF